jgi:hypothetical protein
MSTFNVSRLTRQELRLAYFDFTVRGEGDRDMVSAVLLEWLALGGISEQEFRLWNDALEWRELGNRLPGWTDPVHQPGSQAAAQPATDEDYRRFLLWRANHAVAA